MEVKPKIPDLENVSLSLNRGVPSIEVIETKIMWVFFRDLIFVPRMEVSRE